MKNAHDFPEVYDRLGIDLRDLGCLMLNTENPVEEWIKGEEYISPDPKKFWMKGFLDHWHVTVRYGFLPGVSADDIDAVLDFQPLPTRLNITGLEVFPSPYPDEKYDCVVARVDDMALDRLNMALGVLPNVNTFAQYKAHITIGYFVQGEWETPVLKTAVDTLDLDYGHNLPRL